ncbi:histidine--tRNA ligase [soil metagenome]
MPMQKPRGTYDILPDEMKLRNLIDKKIRNVFRNYNYKEIKTPSFEKTELFKRSIGEETDVVSKEMYSFSENEFTLRPEMTASVVRAYLENSLYNESPVTKLFYIGNMFRSERPQAGRFREFYQFGAELIGSSEYTSDVEIILLTDRILKELGITGYKIILNTIGELSERMDFVSALREYLEQYSNDLSETSKLRLQKNPLRILDTKDKKEREILENAPILYEHLSDKSKENFNKVLDSISHLGLSYETDHKLVRGLDYYNGLTFEFLSDDLGAQSAILGGGRYDGLIGMLDGKPTPAIGFAAGYERVMMIMKRNELLKAEKDTIDLYLVCADERYKMKVLELVTEMRNNNISCESDLLRRSVKSQMKEADRMNAGFVIVYGENEDTSNNFKLKKMETGEIENVSIENLISKLKGTKES